MKLQQTARFAVLFLLLTMPLLFGAVHPIISGLYTAFMLLFCGGWLLLNSPQLKITLRPSPWILIIFIILGWLVLCSIPLPIYLVELLSPVRAFSLTTVEQLTGITIKWAPLNYNSSAGLMTAIFFFSLVLYGLTLQKLLETDRLLLNLILYTCIGLGLLEAMYGMLQVISPQVGVLWLSDDTQRGIARGTIIYKNQFASLLNMCWPLSIGAALLKFKAVKIAPPREHGRKRKKSLADNLTNETLQGFFFLFIASFIMMAVLFTESRGGTLAMGLILIVMLFILPMSRKNKLRMTVCLLSITLVYGSTVGFSSIIDRFLLIQGSGQIRLNIWLSSLPILSDHLITGIGYGSYGLLSAIYLKNFPENLVFDRVHNDYLELAIELGIPVALLLFSTLFVFLFLQAKRTLPYRKKKLSALRSSRIVGTVSLCAIAGFLFHGIADFGWRLPTNLLYLVTLFVLVTNGMYSKKRLQSP